MLPPFYPPLRLIKSITYSSITPYRVWVPSCVLTKVADKKQQGEEASHVGGLLVDDFGVWLTGDEPVTKSAGATGMNTKSFLPLISTDEH